MPVSPHQTAVALQRQAAETRAADERRADRLRGSVVEILRAGLPQGGRAWIFGSLAWGGFGERSDLDLALSGVEQGRALALELSLSRALGVEVDLLSLEDLPPPFRARILEDGLAVHDGE
jgi:predicted nucleotidyltransferase